MKKIALPILFFLMLASCGENKSEKLIGLWLLDQQNTLAYQGSGDRWRGELSAVEIYKKDGILFFDKDYADEVDEHFVLSVSEEKISLQKSFGVMEIELGEGGNTFAFMNDLYRKISRDELERQIEKEKITKERLKEESRVQQELAQKQREAERMKNEEERARNKAECAALKSEYEKRVDALLLRFDYKAYRFNDPQRSEVRDQYRAEERDLKDELEIKKKNIKGCW